MTTAREMWCFGPFELDPQARVLFRDGKPVGLTPKQVDTLLVLVRSAGQVVERERLMTEVWPDTFVEESGLTRNISAIRKALEGLETDPIETVPKRGYRFVISVEKRQPQAPPAPSPASAPARVPVVAVDAPPQKRTWWWQATLASLIALAAIFTVMARQPSGRSVTPRFKTLAVLPFQLLSDQQTDKYLGVGLADLLTTRLSGMTALSVRAASTAAHVNIADPVDAGKALGVDAVVHGSLRRSGDRLRLTVQVIDVATGTPMFAGSFDERADALLALESALADSVTSLIVPQLLSVEREARAEAGTRNQNALDAYMRGRYLLGTREPGNVESAIAAFEESRRFDPAFALAYAGLSHAYIIQGDYQYKWPRDVFPKAKAAAIRAIELNGSLADAHAALGEIAWEYDWDWTTAEQSLRRAVDLAPNDPTVHQWLAEFYNATGRTDDAAREIGIAVQLAPRDFPPAAVRAQLSYWNHRFEDTLMLADHAIALSDFALSPMMYKHFALVRLGRLSEARPLFATITDKVKGLPLLEATAAVYDWRDGRRAESDARLRQLEARRATEYVDGIYFATVYADRGDAANAIKWLNQAAQDHSTFIPFIAHDPFYDTLHRQPQFRALVTSVGLARLLHD